MSRITLAHGSGGEATDKLIKNVFIDNLQENIELDLEDAAIYKLEGNRLAFATDSFIVDPLFFPGGDIGKLAIFGTVNDILMRGAKPKVLSASFIIEEGFETEKLEVIIKSMCKACREAKVKIITGDTKVVEKGKADGVFINTSGIGELSSDIDISIKNAKPGDGIIISGNIGDHGTAVICERGKFGFKPPIKSDCAPLLDIVEGLLEYKNCIHLLRDPTRGGVAKVLYEIAEGSNVGIEIWEENLPIQPNVMSACKMLGLDLLTIANEGKLLAVVDKSWEKDILETIREREYGQNAQIIGRVNDTGLVTLKTRLGTSTIIGKPSGKLLPRIC